MDNTMISWCDSTWNPIRGCSKVSEGCRYCFATRIAARFSGPGQPYEGLAMLENGGARWTNTVRVIPEHLFDPLRWQKPRRIFVNSMSDLFHEGLPDREIDRIFAVMAMAPRHTFQVLTKRAHRMRDYFRAEDLYTRWLAEANEIRAANPKLLCVGVSDPRSRLPHWIWLGVSVEDQTTADERVPLLLETPAAVRWVSAEPLLGPIDLCHLQPPDPPVEVDALNGTHGVLRPHRGIGPRLDWVVVGGESGPHMARSPQRWMKHEWARDLRDQCLKSGTAYYFKQSSACRSETGTALENKDGTLWQWRQYPGQLTAPTQVGQSLYLGAFDGPREERR